MGLATLLGAASACSPPTDATEVGAAGSSSGSPERASPGRTTLACAFRIEASISEAIATVGIVTWSTDLEAPRHAVIAFSPDEAAATHFTPIVVPAAGATARTVVLGMKPAREYTARILVENADGSCASEDFTFFTGPLPPDIPTPTVEQHPGAVSRGFILTTVRDRSADRDFAVMFDDEGDLVWWSEAPPSASRARLSWDGSEVWMMSANARGGRGRMSRVSTDGLDRDEDIEGLSEAHHDFTVLPDGGIAVLVHTHDCSAVIERSSDGTLTTLVPDVSSLYVPVRDCHPNAIVYHPGDDSFTISDRNPNLFVKTTRHGELVWQLGGTNPRGPHFGGAWTVNHGHQMLPNGNFLFFNNEVQVTGTSGSARRSSLVELELDPAVGRATAVWTYTDPTYASGTLGDVQRLSGGTTLGIYSNDGAIVEVDGSGAVLRVYAFPNASIGYAMHYASFGGAPPR